MAWTGHDFKAWQTRLGLTNEAAATELGAALKTIKNYRTASEISRMCELACAELERRFREHDRPERWEVQLFTKNGGMPVTRPSLYRRFSEVVVAANSSRKRNPNYDVRVLADDRATPNELDLLQQMNFIQR